MAIELKHLQILYGTVGARDKFEQMCSLLVKGECPSARAIRVYKGDGGVDQSVGQWDGESPVTVFQQKYFPDRVGDAQKQEIRDSYKVAQGNGNFSLTKWVLCIPINLSADEQRWWDEWKAKQDPTGQVIHLWAAVDIERLLMKAENHGVKEEFFQQEHISKIREMHQAIVVQGRSAAQTTDEERFAQQRASYNSPLLDQVHSRGYWEFVLRPGTFVQRRIPDTASVEAILARAAVRISSSWSIPTAEELIIEDDWVAQETDILWGPRVLRYYKSGQFVYTLSFVEDWLNRQGIRQLTQEEWEANTSRYLAIGWPVTLMAAMFMLAARLSETEPYNGDRLYVEIRATSLRDRSLYDADRHAAYGKATGTAFTYHGDYEPGQLAGIHRQEALSAAEELFRRFGVRCSTAELEGYINIQGRG